MTPIPMLEMHVAHACNLACESCSHFSNHRHSGMVSLEEAEGWMRAWNGRLRPAVFGLLGGEPTLHPRLAEFLYLARRHWPDSRLVLTTNAFFLDRHARLPQALEGTGTLLRLTKHHSSPEYEEAFHRGVRLVVQWDAQYRFRTEILLAETRWTRRYQGQGADVVPFEDGAPRQSWKNCPAKECRQLFRGRLWKCAPIAYLQLQKETYPTLSSEWNRYLAYQGLEPSCSDEELRSFLTAEEEDICSMCPKEPIPFRKPCPLPGRRLSSGSRAAE